MKECRCKLFSIFYQPKTLVLGIIGIILLLQLLAFVPLPIVMKIGQYFQQFNHLLEWLFLGMITVYSFEKFKLDKYGIGLIILFVILILMNFGVPYGK